MLRHFCHAWRRPAIVRCSAGLSNVAQACEACDESAVIVRLSVWRRMVPVAGLRFARREVGLRSNPDAGAVTTNFLGRHPYPRAAVMGYSSATDRTDLSRRERLALPDFRLRTETSRSEVGRRPAPSAAARAPIRRGFESRGAHSIISHTSSPPRSRLRHPSPVSLSHRWLNLQWSEWIDRCTSGAGGGATERPVAPKNGAGRWTCSITRSRRFPKKTS